MTWLKNRWLHYWEQLWEQRFFRWVDQRAPRARSITLNRRNLYIFPNLNGALFLVVIGVIWLLGTNYQNNLILAVSYLLVSLFVVAIYHTYANLAGIRVKFLHAQPGFAGEDIAFVLELSCANKNGCDHIELCWPNAEPLVTRIPYGEPCTLTLWAKSSARGYFHPGRLRVQSHFPIGIIRCWTWLNLEAVALVYPTPLASEEPRPQAQGGREEEGSKAVSGDDDFHGLREYQAGDPIKQIAWKQYAQEKGLFSKEYQQLLSAEKWLDWDSLSLPQELRLSGLCHWALIYEQQQHPYGLQLPGSLLEPARGDAHLQQVLSALAQFNLPPCASAATPDSYSGAAYVR